MNAAQAARRVVACGWALAAFFLCSCARISGLHLSSNASAAWRAQEGYWKLIDDGEAPSWSHADPFLQSGSLGQLRVCYAGGSFAATIRMTTATLDGPWAALIVGARSPLAFGPWGPGVQVRLLPDSKFENSLLEIEDVRTGRHTGPVPLRLPLVRVPIRMRVETRGTSLTVYVNGNPAMDYQTPGQAFIGEVGLANRGSTVEFREVVARGEIIPRPRAQRVMKAEARPEVKTGVAALPRVGVRRKTGGGEFYLRDFGETFHPLGFNYTIIGVWSHAMFNVGIYDPQRSEADLAAMKQAGANCVRVWAWGEGNNGAGVLGAVDSKGFNPKYMANFIDFLSRAACHGLRVVAVLDECPLNGYYLSILERTRSNDPGLRITGHNRQFLANEWITAKAAHIHDFIQYIRDYSPELLSVVLAWELNNEAFANVSEGPFLATSGRVKLINGRRYDMNDFAARQACWDDGIGLYARKLARAIRRVDRKALVAIGCWTAEAAGRPAYNGLPADGRDPRVPPRPAALARRTTGLDFLDLHNYAVGDRVHLDEKTHERTAVRKSGIPVIIGEFGIFQNRSIDQERARNAERALLKGFNDFGYQGALFWTWNLCGAGTWCWPELGEKELRWPGLNAAKSPAGR